VDVRRDVEAPARSRRIGGEDSLPRRLHMVLYRLARARRIMRGDLFDDVAVFIERGARRKASAPEQHQLLRDPAVNLHELGVPRHLHDAPMESHIQNSVFRRFVPSDGLFMRLITARSSRISSSEIFSARSLAAALAHDVAIMRGGELVEYGSASKVFATPQHPYTQRLVSARAGKCRDRSMIDGEIPPRA
jgi:hypothetical protein